MQSSTNSPQLKRKRRRKRKNGLGYVILFAFVFTLALVGLSYIVKSFSPDVDVAIGNNEALTLNDSEMEVEIKTIDERLKWIQMEDELPTVSIRTPKEKTEKNTNNTKTEEQNNNKNDVKKNEKKNTKNIVKKEEAPRPTISDFKKDFRLTRKQNTETTETEKHKISKVYVGNFTTIEEAVQIQNKISLEETEIIPFIKSLNGKYIVQLGSFSDEQRASSLVTRMKAKGYSAKIMTEK